MSQILIGKRIKNDLTNCCHATFKHFDLIKSDNLFIQDSLIALNVNARYQAESFTNISPQLVSVNKSISSSVRNTTFIASPSLMPPSPSLNKTTNSGVMPETAADREKNN